MSDFCHARLVQFALSVDSLLARHAHVPSHTRRNLQHPWIQQVYICRPRAAGIRATFYKSMLPEIPLAISQNCHRFFHEEDFEFAVLRDGSCPYSRVADVGDYGPL